MIKTRMFITRILSFFGIPKNVMYMCALLTVGFRALLGSTFDTAFTTFVMLILIGVTSVGRNSSEWNENPKHVHPVSMFLVKWFYPTMIVIDFFSVGLLGSCSIMFFTLTLFICYDMDVLPPPRRVTKPALN